MNVLEIPKLSSLYSQNFLYHRLSKNMSQKSTLDTVSFSDETHFCCQVMLILQKTSSWVAKHLITVCKGHCNLWSALPRLAYQSKASQGQQASRTATHSLRQSTTSDVFRCLACSGPHIADRDGLSEPYRGSKRMMPPSIAKIESIGMATTIFPCATDQPQM